MKWSEMREAVDQAERVIQRADSLINDVARMCKGKLQSAGVNRYTLEALKKELKNYNMHTGQWRKK